jgi:hypothetical protein
MLAPKTHFAEAHSNYGKLLNLEGSTAGTVEHYSRVPAINLRSSEAMDDHGVELFLLGDSEEGVPQIREAWQLNVEDFRARQNLMKSEVRATR